MEALGAYYTSTTTGTGSTTTLVDTDIAEWGEDNDAFSGWYVRMTSGDADGQHRRIKGSGGFTFSSTTLTFTNAFDNNPNTGQTYELSPYSPDDIHAAIAASLRFNYKNGLYLPIRDESLIVDNILSNQGFEDTSSSPFTSWESVGSPTISTETSLVFHGTNSAKIVSGGGAAGQLRQLAAINVRELRGKEITFKMMVFAEAGTIARLILNSEISTTETLMTNGSYHAGDGEWERLEVSGTVAADAQRVIAICDVIAGAKTAYFDDGGDCGLFIDDHPVYQYAMPTTISDGPHRVEQQYSVDDVDGRYDPFPPSSTPVKGRILRLEGKGILTRPSTDSATTEIGPENEELVIAQAIVELGMSHATRAPDEPEIDVAWWQNRVDRLLSMPGGRMLRMSAEMPNDTWHIEQDSAGRYLIFDRVRATALSDTVL